MSYETGYEVPPPFTDITEQLPRNPGHPGYVMRESLAGLNILGIHYDAERVAGPYAPVERYRAQANFHMNKDWDPGPGVARGFGLMYHYRISWDGRLWRTQPELLLTWNANNANRRILACCLDLGPGQEPSQAQLVTLQRYCDWICYGRPDLPNIKRRNVWGHGELKQFRNDTSCPGKLLPYVQQYRKGGSIASAPVPPSPSVESGRQYTETGHSVAGPILRYFDEHGGVAIFGYPIGARREERLEDGKTYTVQYFQKARLELHPEIGREAVLPGNIGAELLQLRDRK